MPEYTVTTEQFKMLHNYLTVKAGGELADLVCDNHPKTLTTEHVAETGGRCKAFIVGLEKGEDHILIVWTDDGGMDLPEGTGAGEYLCGVYRNEISEEAIVLMSGSDRDFPL